MRVRTRAVTRPAARSLGATLAATVGVVALLTLAGCSGTTRERPRPAPTVTVPEPRSLEPTEDEATPDPGTPTEEGEREVRKGKPSNTAGVERTADARAAATLSRARVRCPGGGTTVSDARELERALRAARPGSVIRLADGTYEGSFRATTSGTAAQPIWLCGGASAVLQGGGIRSGYVVHLDGARYWRLVGFSVRDGQKGVMADGTVGTVIQGLTVDTMGDEGIHLRRNSTDNRVIANRVGNTGQRRDKFGEGVYVGSAISNWCRISACQPDRSDRNVVADNVIGPTTSENIDIKEGTVGGRVVGNRFDGSGTVAADSWVDVKGTAWLIEDNTGTGAPLDGFQTHQIEKRWGERNLFRGNVVVAGRVPQALSKDAGERYGFAFRPSGGNVLTCDNRVQGGIPLATVACSSAH